MNTTNAERPEVLIVEDEQIVALDLAQRLKQLGYRVIGMTASGSEAVEIAGKQSPDLVLMDIRLQGDTDGIQAADRIGKVCQAPVVFITAFSDDETLARAKTVGP